VHELPPPTTYDFEVRTAMGGIVARLTSWEEAPEQRENVKLRLEFNDEVFEALHESSFFHALLELRRRLEPKGMMLVCYGASENVFPSGMAVNMGNGGKAYRLTLGRPALMADLVDIFDTGPDVVPVSVEKQEAFFQTWLRSARK